MWVGGRGAAEGIYGKIPPKTQMVPLLQQVASSSYRVHALFQGRINKDHDENCGISIQCGGEDVDDDA